jgi:hypothetical protein
LVLVNPHHADMPTPTTQQNDTRTATDSRAMPALSRAAELVPATYNEADNTIDVVWTTGAMGRRYDWYNDTPYDEELLVTPEAVDMSRFEAGVVQVIDNHDIQGGVRSILGIAIRGSIANGEGRATLRLSTRPELAGVVSDIRAGIIRSISFTYRVSKYEITRAIDRTDGINVPLYRAVAWEPYEISFVTVPFDAGASTRSAPQNGHPCEFITRAPAQSPTQQEPTMPMPGTQSGAPNDASTEQTRAAAPAAAAAPTTAAPAPAPAAPAGDDVAARAAEIVEMCTRHNVGHLAAGLIRGGNSVDQARAAVLDERARNDASAGGQRNVRIQTVSDETEQRRSAIGDAIALRANPNASFRSDTARLEAARQYRGMTLMDMARESIEAGGGSARSLSRREIAVMALNLDRDMQGRAGMNSTSDFPQILASTVNRTLRAAYELQARTFTSWARESTAPDFREVARTQLSESTAFKQINPGGEYKMIQFGESAEKYSLSKFGGIVALTWETLINDDLGAFDRIPLALAAEAAAMEGDIVYGILTGASLMSDGVALFDAAHNNLAAAGSAITDVTLGAGRAAMRKQVGLKGRVLNLTPSILIVGPDNETAANKYTSASFVAAKAGDINPNYNTSLEVVVDPRIQGNAWHLAATPALVDTIEYAYLEGEQGLFTETRQGFEVDGLQIKARHVFGAKAIDWRGMYKNAGQ